MKYSFRRDTSPSTEAPGSGSAARLPSASAGRPLGAYALAAGLSAALCVLGAGFLSGCGDSDSATSGSGGAGASGTGGDGNGGASANCEGVLTFLQKDAYKETAGRTSALWPPHTTTTFEITCDGESVSSGFMANHGTEPDATDESGALFLEAQGTVSVNGSRADLEALYAAYGECECDTSFLSLDALEDGVVQELVGEVTDYMIENLTCTGDVTATDLATKLSEGDIEGVLVELPNCEWASGADWETGLNTALETIIAAANETLAEYHVCNNDALIQQELINAYAADKTVGTCAAQNPLCRGPAWYFEP